MKVAIAGYGAEGKSSYRYFVDKGNDVTIVTNRVSEQFPIPEGAQSIVSDDAFSRLENFELVVRTPPMRPDSIVTSGKIWSQTNEFFAQCPAPIIGVTGTKGKGTTSSFIASILNAGGYTVHLVGNIGQPPLDVLPSIAAQDVVVYELSSFQLWDLEKSPHTAVLLMIEPDHLDIHRDFAEYVAAKANITRFQTESDVLVYNAENTVATVIAAQSKAKKVPFPFEIDEFVSSLQIPGVHNVENAAAAIAAVRAYVQDPEVIRQGLAAFHGLPHRLKFVREVRGVSYYDDSIATTPGSAIAAMRSFDAPKLLILGGSDKGAEYEQVVAVAKETGTRVLAIGQTGTNIQRLCEASGVDVVREEGRMDAVVKRASELSVPGGVVLLSPASASFDQYKSYTDRGEQFVVAVGEL